MTKASVFGMVASGVRHYATYPKPGETARQCEARYRDAATKHIEECGLHLSKRELLWAGIECWRLACGDVNDVAHGMRSRTRTGAQA